MELIKIITYKNNRIVYFDGKNLLEDELCKWINKIPEFGIKNDINLFLLDVTGTRSTPKVKDAASLSMEKSINHFGKVYSALVGLTPLQRIIANAISRKQHFAANIEDAKNWLVTKALSDV